MSQYFSPQPRTRRFSAVSERTEETSATATTIYWDAEETPAQQVDLEQSIYIFPNPGVSTGIGSELSSPFATSSELSVPTDISFPPSTTSGSQTRDGRGRRTNSNASLGTGSGWEAFSRRSISADTGLHSPAVEVWEISGDEGVISGASSDIGTAELEEAIERASRWDLMHGTRFQRPGRRYPLGRQAVSNPFTYAEGRFQSRRRLRSHSSASLDARHGYRRQRTVSYRSSRSLGRECRPHPSDHPPRLPLFSILCSFLSLDDSTIHLLTRPAAPTPSSLFPGPRLQSEEKVEETKVLRLRRRSLARLGAPELESVKEGIEVVCDASVAPDNRLALPLPSFPLSGLWDLVTGVCTMPIKAWSHVRRPSRPVIAS